MAKISPILPERGQSSVKAISESPPDLPPPPLYPSVLAQSMQSVEQTISHGWATGTISRPPSRCQVKVSVAECHCGSGCENRELLDDGLTRVEGGPCGAKLGAQHGSQSAPDSPIVPLDVTDQQLAPMIRIIVGRSVRRSCTRPVSQEEIISWLVLMPTKRHDRIGHGNSGLPDEAPC